MKNYRILFGASALLLASGASAADWYNNASAVTRRIEQASDGSIWLMTNGSAQIAQGASGSCNITQIHLVPPAGKEKDWLAMILAATMSGTPVNVFGDCVAASYLINASRLVIEYQ